MEGGGDGPEEGGGGESEEGGDEDDEDNGEERQPPGTPPPMLFRDVFEGGFYTYIQIIIKKNAFRVVKAALKCLLNVLSTFCCFKV